IGWALVQAFNTLGPGLFFIPVPLSLIPFAMVIACLTGVLASALPARRAARLDPAVAIRYV
ncbi:MAG: ABC transporter permease, partial [Haliea sp.]